MFDNELKRCLILDRSPARLQCTHGYLIGHADKKMCKNHARIPPDAHCDPPYTLVDGMCEKRRAGPAEVGCLPGEEKRGYKCVRADHIKMVLKCPEGFEPHETHAREGTCEKKHSWPGVWFANAPHCYDPDQETSNDRPKFKPTVPPAVTMFPAKGSDAGSTILPHVWMETIYETNGTRVSGNPEVVCSRYEYRKGWYVCEDPKGIPFEEWIRPVSEGGHGNWPLLHYMSEKVGNPKFSCVVAREYPWRPVCPDFRGRAFVRTLLPQHNYFWYERPPGLIWAAGKVWIDIYKRLRSGEVEDVEVPEGSEWTLKKKSEIQTRPQDEAEEPVRVGNLTPGFLEEENHQTGSNGPTAMLDPGIGEQLAGGIIRGRRMQRIYEWASTAADRRMLAEGGPRAGASLTGPAWNSLNKRIWRGEDPSAQDQIDVGQSEPLWSDLEDSNGLGGLLERFLEESNQHISFHDAASQQLLHHQLAKALGLIDSSQKVTVDNQTIGGRQVQVLRVPLNQPARYAQAQQAGRQKIVADDPARYPKNSSETSRINSPPKRARMKFDPVTVERPGPVDELEDPEDYRAAAAYTNKLIQKMFVDLHASAQSQDYLGVENLLKALSPKPRSIDVASRLWVSWIHEGLLLPVCVEYETRKPRQRCTDGFKMGTDQSCKPTDYAPPFLVCPPEYNFEPESVMRWKNIDELENDKKIVKKELKRSSAGKNVEGDASTGGENLVIRTKNMPKCIGFVQSLTEYYCDDPNCLADLENRICVCDLHIKPADESPTREELRELWKLRGTNLYDMNVAYMNRSTGTDAKNSTLAKDSGGRNATDTASNPSRNATESAVPSHLNALTQEFEPVPTPWYPFTSTLFPLYIFRKTFREVFTPDFRERLFKLRELKTNPDYAIFRATFDPRDYIHWVRRKRDLQTEYIVSMTADRILIIANRGKIAQQLYTNAYEPSEYSYGGAASARLAKKPLDPAPVVDNITKFEYRQDLPGERFGPPVSLVASADQSAYVSLGGTDRRKNGEFPIIHNIPEEPANPRQLLSKKADRELRQAYEIIRGLAKTYDYEPLNAAADQAESQDARLQLNERKNKYQRSLEKHVLGLLKEKHPFIKDNELQQALHKLYEAPAGTAAPRSAHSKKHDLNTTSILHEKEDTIIDLYARPNLNRWRQSIRTPIVLSETGERHFATIPEDYW